MSDCFSECPRCGYAPDKPSGGRRRKPQRPGRFPPSLTPAEIEAKIDSLCGCGGRNDCDCVSVFNKACSAAWWDHNTKAA